MSKDLEDKRKTTIFAIKMKILYIGPKMTAPKNGGDKIEFRNQNLLDSITNEEIIYISPDFRYTSLFAKFRLSIGLTKEKKNELRSVISTYKFDIIFVSQSTYGAYVKYLKSFSSIPVVTFFHNAEINYFISAHKSNKKKFSGLIYIIKVLWCEYLSNRYSDKIITLNERDSQALKKYYGRGADFIWPTTFEDVYDEEEAKDIVPDIDCLFVGSNFFANTQGLQWFIDSVLPYINGELYIIGNGMDRYIFTNLDNRVHIKGFVNNLAEYYYRAKVIISPIFCGSGMKTKTAEALMYGKIIIGTTEAFEGYIINSECMKLCYSAGDFIDAINKIIASSKEPINKTARNHFTRYYSNDSCLFKLKHFLEETRITAI